MLLPFLTLLAQTTEEEMEAANEALNEAAANLGTAATAAGVAATGIAALAIGWIIFWAVFALLSLIFFIWWIFMLIDCVKRDFPEKNTYLIVLIVGLFIPFGVVITTLIYYFAIYKKYKAGGGAAPAAPAAPRAPAQR